MKKSEAIRQAVDRYLSPVFEEDTYQLCNCIERLRGAGHLSAKEAEEIKKEICYFLGYITMVGAHAHHYNNHTEYLETAQNLRFMFAEFLALMWEDEEANAQAEVS